MGDLRVRPYLDPKALSFFWKERRGPRVSSNFQKKPLTGDALTNSYVKVCQGVWSLFEGVCEITLLSGEACYFYLREISSDKHHVFYFLVVTYLLINISCIGHFVLVQEGTWKVRRTGSKEEMATRYWSKLAKSTSIHGCFLPRNYSPFRSHPFDDMGAEVVAEAVPVKGNASELVAVECVETKRLRVLFCCVVKRG